jgi:hypothetical protein
MSRKFYFSTLHGHSLDTPFWGNEMYLREVPWTIHCVLLKYLAIFLSVINEICRQFHTEPSLKSIIMHSTGQMLIPERPVLSPPIQNYGIVTFKQKYSISIKI